MAAVQRSGGNIAAGHLVAQRMTEGAETDAVADTTREDLDLVRAYRAEVADPHVQDLLDELLSVLGRVSSVEREHNPVNDGGGSTRNLGGNRYHISYQTGSGTSVHDRLAVLVHELTHVLVNESYDSDMLNRDVPALTPEEQAEVGTAPNREELAQTKRLGKLPREDRFGFEDRVIANAGKLLEQLPGSGLPEATQSKVRVKLEAHTRPRPNHEYDAVLSHILVWCEQAGATSSPFYRTLTGLVQEASGWRRRGAVDSTPPPGSAPAPAPGPGRGPSKQSGTKDRMKKLVNKLKR